MTVMTRVGIDHTLAGFPTLLPIFFHLSVSYSLIALRSATLYSIKSVFFNFPEATKGLDSGVTTTEAVPHLRQTLRNAYPRQLVGKYKDCIYLPCTSAF